LQASYVHTAALWVQDHLMAAPKPKRKQPATAQERDKRMTQVSDLWLRSMTPQQIADTLGVSRSEVFGCMRRLEEEWVRHRILNVTAIKNRELSRLAYMERRAWEAFDRSEQELQHTRQRSRNVKKVMPQEARRNGSQPKDAMPQVILESEPEPETQETEALVRTEQKTGDPRYLLVLTRIEQQRMTLLGLDQTRPDEGDKREPIGVIEVYLDEDGKPRGELYGQEAQPEPEPEPAPEIDDDGTLTIDIDPGQPRLPAPEDAE
jgi:hypothetical protein